MNSVMEFILRMKDEASAGIARVRASLTGTADAARQAKPDMEGLTGTIKGFSESFHRAARVMGETLGVIGLVYAAFRASFEGAKKVMEWSGFFEADTRLKEATKTLAASEATKKRLAEFEDEEKARLAGITEEYDRQAAEVGKLTKKLDALAAAREKEAASRLSQKMTQINADERYALAQGYDPEAVKVLYDDERRRAQADAGVASAQSGAEAAGRAVGDAEKAYEVAVSRSIALKDQIVQAESQKAAARKALFDLEGQFLTEEERQKKRSGLMFRDRKADATIGLASRELEKAGLGEDAARDAVEVAKAEAAAAAEAVNDALLTRQAAEFDYQADVQAFWDKRDGDEREARQAALDAVREQMDERRRLADEAAAAEHARRVEDIKAEAAAGEQAEAAAQDRLSRAHSAAQTAWGWYRDPESFRRQLAEEKADAAAERQFAADAKTLTQKFGWRDARLDDRQESVRRVVLAREEERRAEQALVQIEENTRQVARRLDLLLSMRGG